MFIYMYYLTVLSDENVKNLILHRKHSCAGGLSQLEAPGGEKFGPKKIVLYVE